MSDLFEPGVVEDYECWCHHEESDGSQSEVCDLDPRSERYDPDLTLPFGSSLDFFPSSSGCTEDDSDTEINITDSNQTIAPKGQQTPTDTTASPWIEKRANVRSVLIDGFRTKTVDPQELEVKKNLLVCYLEGCPLESKMVCRSAYEKHLKYYHNSERRFACPREGCGKKFARKVDVANHIKLSHEKVNIKANKDN
ncbi:hypothetical protein BO71DRAFT_401872 [Aspergillus ellipticus CBS 707.79]|uniref:C2H2-type domain-containing protein n=1 Tax=Aspergillus ellipticus CBS 707.79 TaxID=1448320 RepID=A0A319D1D8_9EURO|nr:hypothetical protein BO71DRAFT_401872 [Aspergillus ellipticus CBS 707.79]